MYEWMSECMSGYVSGWASAGMYSSKSFWVVKEVF